MIDYGSVFFTFLIVFLRYLIKFYLLFLILREAYKLTKSMLSFACVSWTYLMKFFEVITNPGKMKIPIFGNKIVNILAFTLSFLDLFLSFVYLIVTVCIFIALAIVLFPLNIILMI